MLSKAAELIAQFEGCHLSAYKCPANVWTIGYGQTGDWVKQGTSITQEKANKLLNIEIEKIQDNLSKFIKVKLTANQMCALISFVYNIGIGAFKKSTMLKLINAGDLTGAATQFLQWAKVNGVKSKGLLIRRLAERQLFLQVD
jgi:lysozyme